MGISEFNIQNNKYTFSVIVIGYNIERYLKECLNSIFEQDYTNYEVVFVDDGSTDSTLSIARLFDDHSNFTIVSKINGGIISARKEGLKVSTGKYVVFVDGDDYVPKDMLSHFSEKGDLNGEYDLIISDFLEETLSGKQIKRSNNYGYGCINSDDYICGIFDGGINHNICSRAFCREFLIKCGYYELPNLTTSEDLITNVLVGLNGARIIYINASTYFYRYNISSSSRSGSFDIVDNHLSALKLIERITHELSNDKYEEYLRYQYYLFVFNYIQMNFGHDFNKYLVAKYKPKLRHISCNSIYKKQIRNLSLYYGRSLIFAYMYIPFASFCYNGMCRILISILRKLNFLRDY